MKFRLFGFSVTVNWSFLVVMTLFGLDGERDEIGLLVWVAVAFVSILAHELGHAFAFRRFGYPASIEFEFMGAVTWPHTLEPIRPRREVLISVAGPLVGVVVGGLILAFHSYNAPAAGQAVLDRALSDLAWANLGWGLFNLVPVYPLDGGRVMTGLLQLATGGRAQRAGLAISAVAGTVLGLAALALLAPLAAVVCGYLVWWNLRELGRTAPGPGNDEVAAWLSDGYNALEVGAAQSASNRARQVMAHAPSEALRNEAGRLLAWSHLLDRRPDSAAEVMEWWPFTPAEPVLHPRVVASAGGTDRAIGLLAQAYTARPSPATGLVLARALVEAGDLDAAISLVSGSTAEHLGNDAGALVAGALFLAERWEDAARVGEQTYAHHPHPTLAYNVACSWARLGQADETLEWLRRAVDTGYSSAEVFDEDPDLELVRGRPEFAELRQKLEGVQAQATRCYRHPSVFTPNRCHRCERPICPECTVGTSEGWKCVDCASDAARPDRAPFTPGVLGISVVLVAVYVAQKLWPHLDGRLGDFSPASENGEWYRLFTATLLHVDVTHLVGNVLVFVVVGRLAERHLGTARFVAVYVASGVTGALAAHLFRPGVWLAMGASGAIAGVLGASGVALFERWRASSQPFRTLALRVLVAIAVLIYLFLWGDRDVPEAAEVDDFAHVGGLVAGVVLAMVTAPRLARSPRLAAGQFALVTVFAVGAVGLVGVTGEQELPPTLVAVGHIVDNGAPPSGLRDSPDVEFIIRYLSTTRSVGTEPIFSYQYDDAQGRRHRITDVDMEPDGLWLDPDRSVTAALEGPCVVDLAPGGGQFHCRVVLRQRVTGHDEISTVISDGTGAVVHRVGTTGDLRTLDFGSVTIELRDRDPRQRASALGAGEAVGLG